jgi:hypothetical protein
MTCIAPALLGRAGASAVCASHVPLESFDAALTPWRKRAS